MNSGEVFSLSLHAMLVVCVAARVVHFLLDVFNPSSSVWSVWKGCLSAVQKLGFCCLLCSLLKRERDGYRGCRGGGRGRYGFARL